MDYALFIIGVLGNITALSVFLSPIPTFRAILANHNTGEHQPEPYVFILLNALLWLYYGVTKANGLLIATINGFGAVVESIYVAIFLVFAANRCKRVRTAILAAVFDIGISGAVVAATTFAISQLELRVTVIGMICACFNVLMYASPLTAVIEVIRTRRVDGMPFLLSFFLFSNGAVWLVYGILDRDNLIGIPNGIGFFLGAIQLIVYAIYCNSRDQGRLPVENIQAEAEAPLMGNDVQEQEDAPNCCRLT